jgi:hypothetical protein
MKRLLSLSLPVAAIACVATAVLAVEPAAPPATPKRPVSTDYDDLKVSEDYRWLEDHKAP